MKSKQTLAMFNKILYCVSFCFCVLAVCPISTDILGDEGMQVSVDDQNFDADNFFDLEGMGFQQDKVNFNKGWLGIFMENAEGKGVLVKEIIKGSPAAEAGLKTGDIVTKINDETTVGKDGLNVIQFKKTVETVGADGIPLLTISRDGAEMMLKPKLVAKLRKDVMEPVTSFISKTRSKYLKPSFMEFAMKNEKYRGMFGAALQRIGEEVYAREGFQSDSEANPFRLSIINYLMLHPLDTPWIGQAIHDRIFDKDSYTQIGCAGEMLDVKLNFPKIKQEPFPVFVPCGEDSESGHLDAPSFSFSQEGNEGVIKSPKDPFGPAPLQKIDAANMLQGQLQLVIDSLPACVSLIRESFCNLSREEFEFLYQNIHKVWLPDEKLESCDLARLLALSQKVDLAKLFEAISLLLNKLDPLCSEQGVDVVKRMSPDVLQNSVSPFHLPTSILSVNSQDNANRKMQSMELSGKYLSAPGGSGAGGGGAEEVQDSKNSKGFDGDILFVQDTSIGKIVVGGTGTSYYYADAAVIIDLGGNDYYFNNAGASNKDMPLSICIDFSGDDVYDAASSFAQGTGRFGIGLLMDLGGDDKYIGKEFAQGACLFGVGLLTDYNGDDFYSGHVVNQGIGFFGTGILSDLQGNDVYFSRQFAQGVGFTKGFGALIDVDGNDFYFAGGRYPDFRDPEKSFQSMSQGMGIGIRPEETIVGASGGVGVLIDQKGADRYYGDYFSQGSGYYYALGVLCDKEGDDRYYAGRYAQGAGIHSAIGLLEDTSGDDTYECSFGVSQGCGHDTGIGFLVDGCGDDTYRSKTASQGVGLEKGMGVLADFYGNDVYQANDNSQGVSFPSKTEDVIGIGMLIDNQGDHDIFHDIIAENLLFYRPNGGLILNKQ